MSTVYVNLRSGSENVSPTLPTPPPRPAPPDICEKAHYLYARNSSKMFHLKMVHFQFAFKLGYLLYNWHFEWLNE